MCSKPPKLSEKLVDKVAENCIDCFKTLPKTGKPADDEWTVLSCIAQFDRTTENIEVVSLGTGSKCIGASKMSSTGDVLNDSHAEVICRRSFLLYLYDNIEKCIDNKECILLKEDGKFKLKDNIDFIFYSSQLPCGDAVIFPKNLDQEEYGDILQPQKRHLDSEDCDTESKQPKLESDIHRTGAKCLPHSDQDSKSPGSGYHLQGRVRTKPGRGDRTLSVSCSDKIARWIHLGVQGSLLDMLIVEPVFIKHFIFGAGVPYSIESINRALLTRNGVMMATVKPEFYQSSVTFPLIKSDICARPAPGSIIWVKKDQFCTEVTVQGKRQGLTKKKAATPNHYLCISKYKLYTHFINILDKNCELKQIICCDNDLDTITYSEMKKKSKRYIENWLMVKNGLFKTWTLKPDMWNFCVS